jgi:hypothetical protein
MAVFVGTEHRLDASQHRNIGGLIAGHPDVSLQQAKMHAYRFSKSEQLKFDPLPFGSVDVVDRTEAIRVDPRVLEILDLNASHRPAKAAVLGCQFRCVDWLRSWRLCGPTSLRGGGYQSNLEP